MNRFIQKALCAVAACALALSLSACGSTSPATGAASAPESCTVAVRPRL